MKIRAPRPSDLLWFALFAFLVAGFRLFFAAEASVACPQGTGCYDAWEQSFGVDGNECPRSDGDACR